MYVTRQEKENGIVELHKQGKTSKQIAQELHMSFTDIGRVLRKNFPDEYESIAPVQSKECNALRLFSEGKSPLEVAIILNSEAEIVLQWYRKYLSLRGMHGIVKILIQYKDQLNSLFRLLRDINRSKLGLKGASITIGNKSQLLYARRELSAVESEIAKKRMELADLVLDTIPDANRDKTRAFGRPLMHRRCGFTTMF